MILAVIPARYASTRFPGKPLADLAGKSMIRRVYERVSQTERIDRVVVATDDERIRQHVHAFGGLALMTDTDHPTGTDRVAEVARVYPEAEIVVNVQGDEPFIDPRQINAVIDPFASDPEIAITTLALPIRDEQALFSPNVVKVVRDERGRATYFSRHAIPYLRDVALGQWILRKQHFQHLGLYAFRAGVLQDVTALPPGELEKSENLEQLRWLAANYPIHVGITDVPAFGIDTPEDLKLAVTRLLS